MAEFSDPLSGPAGRALNPWGAWARAVSAQMGFINIIDLKADDPALEQKLSEQVAGHGRRLGRLTDVLLILLERADLKHLTDRERAEIAEFREMAAEIETPGSRRRSPEKLLETLEAVLAEIRALKEEHPETHERALHLVREEAAHAARLTLPEAR